MHLCRPFLKAYEHGSLASMTLHHSIAFIGLKTLDLIDVYLEELLKYVDREDDDNLKEEDLKSQSG